MRRVLIGYLSTLFLGLAFAQPSERAANSEQRAATTGEPEVTAPKPKPEAASAGAATGPGLLMSTRFEGRKVLGESFAAFVEITNSTNRPITLVTVNVEGSGALYGIYPECSIVPAKDATLPPGAKVSGTCQLERKKSGQAIPIDPALYLTKLQGTFVVVTATWVGGPPVSQLLPITLTQPEWLVALGALAGVCLLMAFSVSHRLLKGAGVRATLADHAIRRLRLEYSPAGDGASTVSSRSEVRGSRRLSTAKLMGAVTFEVLLSLLQGSAVALILIVFSRTTVDLHAPINIQVEDFWGGVLVGIFSVPLADAIAQRLVGNTPAASTLPALDH